MITTSFPTGEGDPSGNFVFGMARALSRRGHRIEVVAPEPSTRPDWSADAGWLEGVSVIPAPYARPRALQKLFYGAGVPDNLSSNKALHLMVPAGLAGMFAAIRGRVRGWDALVSHWLFPGALLGCLAAGRRIPHLAIAHSGDVHLLGRIPLGSQVARKVLADCHRVGFVSDQLRHEFRALIGEGTGAPGNEKMIIAPMGVDSEVLRFPQGRQVARSLLDLNDFTVLFIGRLVEIKGLDLLIGAMENLGGKSLMVAGDGPLRGELERTALARGVDVKFSGIVEPRERAQLLAACDVLVVPSRQLTDGRHEGMPSVVLEGMTAGIPVIATDTGGVAELISSGRDGLLVPSEDQEALSRAIDTVAEDAELRERLVSGGARRSAPMDRSILAREWESLL